MTLAADVTEPDPDRLSVETDLDLAGSFSLDLRNPDNTLLDSALFDLGKTVEIHLGYGNDLKPAFLGEIAAIEPSFPGDGAPTITVAGYDKSYKMRRSQPEPTEYTLRQRHPSRGSDRGRERSDPHRRSDARNAREDHPGRERHGVPEVPRRRLLLRRLRRVGSAALPVPAPADDRPRPGVGTNLSSFSPRISSAGLAGLAGHPRLQPGAGTDHLRHGAGRGLRPATTSSSGSAAPRWTCSPRWCARESCAPRSRTRSTPSSLAKSLLADLLEGMYEGSGIVHRAPRSRGRRLRRDPRRRASGSAAPTGCAR